MEEVGWTILIVVLLFAGTVAVIIANAMVIRPHKDVSPEPALDPVDDPPRKKRGFAPGDIVTFRDGMEWKGGIVQSLDPTYKSLWIAAHDKNGREYLARRNQKKVKPTYHSALH
ncbi:MAG: hypothetical protein A3G60_00075 [Candidatus Ryanbacteria bacterium RIFCSPLOWO2_12_FULL_47_9c]|uniref:Uncharacterized protein n=2 Tax=Candidatus Ryaniibacteriota TaxID=1817914 RepID=A0A1G2H534_9BACT|nr:MAG: hypothetical protein A3C83_00500 [Candidatus Ryanbacteria bacterium RIFCSPHIGHO2_02_FULL_47_25]OGZ56107.1 MAG: hypothetical protein A3J04_02490 [Candidatus Ryanbacteria bacterium RIFCSPLOWO2_02_FULL_47_14]OGZ57604.1 MAG: hypothetical protein A3G60_00075 [Candidatus Ryanbacteria bacterium RIFCSPLOWO2_12_FULL_47_9c]